MNILIEQTASIPAPHIMFRVSIRCSLARLSRGLGIFLDHLNITTDGWKICTNRPGVARYLGTARRTPETSADPTQAYHWPKLVLFGDSITERAYSRDSIWVAELSDMLVRKCDVVNRGFVGYNTRWLRMLLPRLLTRDMAVEVVGVTLFLGTNDATLLDVDPTQHIPLEEYESNLQQMLRYLQSIGIGPERVLMIDPPPCDDQHWAEVCRADGIAPDKANRTTEQYARVCVQVAEQCGASYVELWANMMREQNWQDMLSDGLHLNQVGSEFLLTLIRPWCLRMTSHLPHILPHWNEIDYKNPASSFT